MVKRRLVYLGLRTPWEGEGDESYVECQWESIKNNTPQSQTKWAALIMEEWRREIQKTKAKRFHEIWRQLPEVHSGENLDVTRETAVPNCLRSADRRGR